MKPCPRCGAPHEAYVDATTLERLVPRRGDLSCCGRCGLWTMVTRNGFRELTFKEIQELPRECQEKATAIREKISWSRAEKDTNNGDKQ